jgi:hypothetical protein
MSIKISETTEYNIKKLSISSKVGEYDLSGMFDELNIFDSLLNPCMSGNILIKDAIGLLEKIYLDGSEFINVQITKSRNDSLDEITSFDKSFRVYKISDRNPNSMTSESYILHFMSEEYIYSEQQKVEQSFEGNYHQMASIVLAKYLKVPIAEKRVGYIEKTRGLHSIVVPNLSPFDTINWLARRSINESGSPDFMFFQNKTGYNFISLSTMLQQQPLFRVNFSPKNLVNEISNELFGATSVKILSQFNLPETIKNGMYAGRFVGFDTLTRKIQIKEINFLDMYNKSNHANKYPNVNVSKNKDGKDASSMYKSKIVVYPFQSARANNTWTKENDPKTATLIDDTDNYVYQRKAIIYNLLQTRVQLTLPGNFVLSSGFNLQLDFPPRNAGGQVDGVDDALNGKYIIIAARHMFKQNKHETVLEVATDSTNRPLYRADSGAINDSRNK